jgi:ectoine hydroxylase-related dioxygenase (phytanoyl-CoA dioxygenase family)
VPGSHTWSEERVADPSEAVSAAMKAGSAFLFLGSTHHGGGTNRTANQYRTGLTTGLDSAAVRQEENMYLALSPDVVKSYPEQIQRLLGWSYMPETYMGWVEIDGEMGGPDAAARMTAASARISAFRPERAQPRPARGGRCRNTCRRR